MGFVYAVPLAVGGAVTIGTLRLSYAVCVPRCYCPYGMERSVFVRISTEFSVG